VDPAVLERLRLVPQREYALAALKIANKDGEIVPLDCAGRPGQQRLDDAIARQQAAGLPVRIILVKSRQFGGSTWIQGYMFKRAATTPKRRVLTVAQKLETAESLFGMGSTMYQHLPVSMKPAMAGYANPTRGSKVMHFGDKLGGFVGGLDSRLQIDTAEEVGGGRGLTYTDLHLTECAHWRDSKKALALLPAVGARPGTSVFLESTANGLNWFHDFFKRAIEAESEYEAVFVGWWEDPDCVRSFRDAEHRREFVESIGDTSRYGAVVEDERWLEEEFECSPEQLYFRRTAISDLCDGKVELFKQEFPATWSEAFIGSGRQVFSVVYTQRAIREAEHWSKASPEDGGPQRGLYVGSEPVERTLSDGTVSVPSKVVWVSERELGGRVEWWPGQFWEPRDPLWTLWMPKERSAEEWRQAHDAGDVDLGAMEAGIARAAWGPGQYVLAGDAAGDTFNGVPSQLEDHAFNTLVGIDHRTGVQVAEFRARMDHDLIARHAYLAGLYLNEAWLSIERTGGYGNVVLDLLQRRFYYRRLYREKVLDDRKQREINRYGWDTNRRTKPQMEGTGQALLREGSHGIRSLLLAAELQTYVKDEKNPAKHEPSPGSFSDLLMAWLQAHEIRRLIPLRPPPSTGPRANTMVRRVRW
jgi:hypothetical protein